MTRIEELRKMRDAGQLTFPLMTELDRLQSDENAAYQSLITTMPTPIYCSELLIDARLYRLLQAFKPDDTHHAEIRKLIEEWIRYKAFVDELTNDGD